MLSKVTNYLLLRFLWHVLSSLKACYANDLFILIYFGIIDRQIDRYAYLTNYVACEAPRLLLVTKIQMQIGLISPSLSHSQKSASHPKKTMRRELGGGGDEAGTWA